MKNIVMAVFAAILVTGSLSANAAPKGKCHAKANAECCEKKTDCVCVPTGDGGCVCVPKSAASNKVAIVAKADKKAKNVCPNRPGCICN